MWLMLRELRLERVIVVGTALGGVMAMIPTLAMRGELSDLLSVETFERMKREKSALQQATVANQGHAPLLHETACLTAIDRFLSRLA